MRDALPPCGLLLTWLALLALVAATLALGYVPMGPFNLVVALVISVIKAALVVVVFMKLLRAPMLARVAAAAGLFWLGALFALSGTDYLTRNDVPSGGPTVPTVPTGREGGF